MKAKEEKGAITLFTVVSILFFSIVLMGLYASSSNKVRKQQSEISTIQSRYSTENIDDAYNREVYENVDNAM